MLTTHLQYRTRGDSSPQGKPRVYFCCHPEDFERFFRQITEEILELQNCAVYYYPPEAEVPLEERELDLGQMNLVVVPVTSRLLYHDNQAAADAAFALERHIPVLPIMQEAHLEETFNKKFGGLHFLNKNDPDPTALPYQEKLKKYLESVLIGDELARQIREAFDAYIFLSYRKKDRKYAQELMRLIHQNDFCRDIAIWYDEFLTPGEEFSKAIEKALEKSRLFTLVVTPSLLEPGNYVMTTEFPMARDSGKPILPAQMSAVDTEELANDYRNIPPCADAHDEPLLRQALLNALETVAKRENDEDPKHNFFIGLAYLGGVDVEMDYERALALITKAAEAGLPEAMEKLVAMYQNGEGVARDYHKAISWQEKLAAWYRAHFAEQSSEADYRKLCNAIWNLGDYRKAVGDLTGATEAYGEMKALSLAQAEVFDTRRDISVSYNKLGNIAEAKGRLDEASDWYRQALELAEALAAETGTIEARRDLSASYNNQGWIAEARRKMDEATGWYWKVLDITKALAEETGTAQARRDLSLSYNHLGRISQARGMLDEACKWYRKALELAEALEAETGTIEARRDLSISYGNLGDIAIDRRKLDEAAEWYRRSLELDEALAAETSTIEAWRELSVSCHKLGNIAKARGKLNEAAEWYRQSLDIHKALAAETGTIEARRDLSISYDKLGNIAETQGRLNEAVEWYQRSLDIHKALAAETGTVEVRRDLSISYSDLGDIAEAQGRLDEAVEWYQRSLDIHKALAVETGTIEAWRDLSISYDKLGSIAETQGRLDEASDWYRQSLDIDRTLAEETGTIEAQRDLSVSYDNLGDIAKAQDRLDEANDWYQQALSIRKALAEETGTVQAQRDLSTSYKHLARIAEIHNNKLRPYGKLPDEIKKAENWFKQAMEIDKALAEETGTVEDRRRASDSYYYLGNIAETRGRLEEASNWYRQALDIDKALAEETGTVQSLDDLAVSYYNLGTLNGINRELIQKAYDIYTQLVQICPSVARYQKNLRIVEKLRK